MDKTCNGPKVLRSLGSQGQGSRGPEGSQGPRVQGRRDTSHAKALQASRLRGLQDRETYLDREFTS
jgi:hypothetical protein